MRFSRRDFLQHSAAVAAGFGGLQTLSANQSDKDALRTETKLCAVIAERGWLLRNRKERWEVTSPDKHLTSLAEVFASTGVRTVT